MKRQLIVIIILFYIYGVYGNNIIYKNFNDKFGTHIKDDHIKYNFTPMKINIKEQQTTILKAPKNAILPEVFSWKGTNRVTNVKNQKECGSCWAFATTGYLEGQTQNGISLSSQQFVDCDSFDNGCDGGDFATAIGYMYTLRRGILSDNIYPYTGIGNTTCDIQKILDDAHQNGIMTLNDGYDYTINNIENTEYTIKYYIYNHGPLYASFNIPADATQSPDGCIIQKTDTCGGGHAVIITGWYDIDDEVYWQFKNSWGSELCDEGYWSIESGTCGINDDIFIIVKSNEKPSITNKINNDNYDSLKETMTIFLSIILIMAMVIILFVLKQYCLMRKITRIELYNSNELIKL